MSMFDGIDEEDLADWRESPVTEHLLGRLVAQRKALSESLESKSSGDNHHHVLAALGGKCVQLRELIQAIKGESK